MPSSGQQYPRFMQVRAGSYVVGVVPQMPPVTMYANWKPFLELLSQKTGLDLKIKVYEKMSDFEADIDAERPDMIFANPIQAAHAAKNHQYLPVVRSSKFIEGVLFVRSDSQIRSADDLADREVAFVGSRNV